MSKMGSFTLSLKNVPGGTVAWEGCYGQPPMQETYSVVLGLGEL